ncbi:hypothetical protein [Limimaricola sp. AA108-03]
MITPRTTLRRAAFLVGDAVSLLALRLNVGLTVAGLIAMRPA